MCSVSIRRSADRYVSGCSKPVSLREKGFHPSLHPGQRTLRDPAKGPHAIQPLTRFCLGRSRFIFEATFAVPHPRLFWHVTSLAQSGRQTDGSRFSSGSSVQVHSRLSLSCGWLPQCARLAPRAIDPPDMRADGPCLFQKFSERTKGLLAGVVKAVLDEIIRRHAKCARHVFRGAFLAEVVAIQQ